MKLLLPACYIINHVMSSFNSNDDYRNCKTLQVITLMDNMQQWLWAANNATHSNNGNNIENS